MATTVDAILVSNDILAPKLPQQSSSATDDAAVLAAATVAATALSNTHLLQASPYSEAAHLLDLRTLAPPLQALARALTTMRPLRTDYATAPYREAFNWAEVVGELAPRPGAVLFPGGRFYVIVFRSQLPVGWDRARLGELDAEAHREAVAGGGLLKYWFGTPDANGRNLATCVWRNRDDARRGGAGPGHADAMREARRIYTEWKVERLALVVSPGAAEWRIEEWVDE